MVKIIKNIYASIFGRREIFDSIEKGDISYIGTLIDNFPQLLQARKKNHNRRPSYITAGNGERGQIELDFFQTINVNVEGYELIMELNMGTPLHMAVELGNERIVNLLIEKGAPINAGDKCLLTPLHWAVDKSNVKLVKLLIEKSADINAGDRNGSTPLHWAANVENYKMMDILVEKGADVNARDNLGQSPLHCAAFRGQVEVIELLIKKGANVNIQDNEGQTPLHSTVKLGEIKLHGRKEAAMKLLESGANPDVQDKEGSTALHLTAWIGCKDIAWILLNKSKANVNLRDNKKQTPMRIAKDEARRLKITRWEEVAGLMDRKGGMF